MARIEELTERDLKVISKASIIAEWIRKDKELTVEEVISKFEEFPEISEFVSHVTLDELLEFFSQYREGRLYGDFIEVILSPKGREWLRKIWPIILEAEKKMKG